MEDETRTGNLESFVKKRVACDFIGRDEMSYRGHDGESSKLCPEISCH
jgi:hypothetical protein